MKPKPKILGAVRPNAELELTLRRKLLALVDEMHRSVAHWVMATYRANEPLIAQDAALPANVLRKAMAELADTWQARFDKAAIALARYFAKAAQDRSDVALKSILRKGGFSVAFKMTAAQRDIIQATVTQSVGLIKSIPAQYLTEVEGMVMRSVQTGRDAGQLSRDLQASYGVTKRRAALIARDQNNKATSAMTHARQAEIGITKAIWLHSGGGKVPRPTHKANDGKTYDVAKGWFDPDEQEWIYPGQLINCRCVSRSIVPGLS